MKKILILLLFLGVRSLFADSPLTSTPFYEAYMGEGFVESAWTKKIVDKEIAKYLLSKKAPTHMKAIVVNALGWDIDGKNNSVLFWDFLRKKRKLKSVEPDISEAAKLTGDDLLCFGYMMALDDYNNPGPAVPFLEKAAEKNKDSYITHVVLALVKAQVAFDSDWCQVWKVYEEADSNPAYKRAIDDQARQIIYDYMVLYRPECG